MPTVVVGTVSSLSPIAGGVADATGRPMSQVYTVTFEGGQTGVLDMAARESVVWAQVLDSQRRADQPVYVELDPNNNRITQLLIPLSVRVGTITSLPDGDGVEVELIISHARHYLRRTNPNYQALLDALQAAQREGTAVLVTESPDTHEIIDVRPAPRAMLPGVPAPPEGAEALAAAVAATPQQAQQMFDLVKTKTCCPASAAAPCIPFQYPDDGCWGRAHEMCRLMIAAGIIPQKVWIYGSLQAPTINHPACAVNWGWHVAPTLQVNNNVIVIDPSLFPAPVTQQQWKNAQGDAAAVLEASSAAVFYRTMGGGYVEYDTNYAQTQTVLNTYRNQLKLRSASSSGPPPYFNCMARPAGVQWFGTIAGGATHRWFTWGWPAASHIVWTIMPLTHCPGNPQLTWSVQVERANATQCTYWITVKNLTSDPVKFEGRYDILKA